MDGQVGLDADYCRPVFPFIQREKFHADDKPVPVGIHLCANRETGYGAGWWVGGGLVVGWWWMGGW